MAEGYLWGDARVTHPDWKGTAQLDQRMTTAGLEEVVGLDPDEWMAVGMDLGGGEQEHGSHSLRVIAVHQDNVPEGGDVLPRIAQANDGEIPVTEFLIHDVDPYEVLRRVTHQFELRLRLSRTVELPIRVVSQSDVPQHTRE